MTYVYKELTLDDMISDLMADEYAGWSHLGARALAEFIYNLSDDLGENICWDRVALRCDFNEYPSVDEVLEDYGMTLEELEDNYTVIMFDGGVIIQA